MHGKCNLIYEAAYHFPASVIVVLRKTRGAHLHCAILLEEEKNKLLQSNRTENKKKEKGKQNEELETRKQRVRCRLKWNLADLSLH